MTHPQFFIPLNVNPTPLLNISPIAWIAGKVIHQYPEMADGFEPLYTLTDVMKLYEKLKGEQHDNTSKDISM